MKLSKREKIMLFILAAMIVVFGYYKFIYGPQHKKIVELQRQLDELKKDKLKSEELLSPENKIYKDYKILNSKIALAEKNFFSKIIQEKIILELDSIINSSNLNVISISFTEPRKEEIKKSEEKKKEESLLEQYSSIYKDIENEIKESKTKDKEEKEDVKKNTEEIDKVEKMRVNIVFKGNNFYELMDFITQLELQAKRVVINNLSIKMEENLLSGIIALDYYSIPKIIDTEEKDDIWNINGNYGVDNPFKYFDGYETTGKLNPKNNVSSSNNISKKSIREVFDFYMGLRPITADLPTVVIGRPNDNNGKSYIYGDNEGIEKVEFRFIKNNGKYYYKYKTELQSLPKKYEEEMLPFTPASENIVLRIISSLRKEENDNSGVYLSLINDTDLKLVVNISNDDPIKPRVNIAKKEGNIVINR